MPPFQRSDLTALLELSQSLGLSSFSKANLLRSLGILEVELSALFALVALADKSNREIRIEAVTGIRLGAVQVKYALGEGITGRVVQSGKPIVVPQASREPLFLDRLGSLRSKQVKQKDLSYIAVPIPVDGRTQGALGLGLLYDKSRDLQRDAQVLAIAASMIGQAIRVKALLDAERDLFLAENEALKKELRARYDLPNLVGRSHPMQQVYELVAQAAPASTTVLIRGESGTGKELVAHAIHYNSKRSDKPFIKVNCAALPESLIESELFGHEAGAFTGADKLKKGRFELAHGGSLFLDEIGELTPAMQVKLLRVIQEREFDRVGGTKPVKVDVRLITATHRNLEAAIKTGAFREDLYYRLNVFGIFLPPLRERRPDILLLADHFVEKYAAAHGKSVRRISTTAIDMLMSYHWPGNVRELENCIERAVLVCDGGVLHAHHLPPTLQTAEVSGTLPAKSLEDSVASFERDIIFDALKICRGNRSKAARTLGTTERIVNYKIAKYQIDCARFKS